MQKSGIGKSERKPLVDISNTRKKLLKEPSAKKKPFSKVDGEDQTAKKIPISSGEEEDLTMKKITDSDKDSGRTLDRLLLAHSQLSILFHQIDEVLVLAFKSRTTCKLGSQEIESFTTLLSEMHSKLKPWVPRFQQAFSSTLKENDSQMAQSTEFPMDSSTNEEENDFTNCLEEPDLGSLISPSPLVSWRAGCRIENGRQLFLLTPLPTSKALSSKCPRPSKSVSEKVPSTSNQCCTLSLPPLMNFSRDTVDDLMDQTEFNRTPKNSSKSAVTKTEKTLDSVIFSPKLSHHENGDCSMYLMTPLLKMSPPKSCRFLEPGPDSCQQCNDDGIKPASTCGGVQDCKETLSSEKSSYHDSGCLALKYQELFGIRLTHKPAIQRQEVENSLDWFLSPPKTCVLMEPTDEKLLTYPAVNDLSCNKCVLNEHPLYMVSVVGKEVSGRYQSTKEPASHGLGTSLAAPESTPLWKDFESTVRIGKQPGENTLKRELWTRFEAVTTSNVLRFDAALVQENKGKGFLDRLEEASCEETRE